MTAFGRLLGPEQALASRYSIAAAVFWVGLAAGAAPLVSQRFAILIPTRSGQADVTGLAYVSACVCLSLLVNLASSPSRSDLEAIRTRSEPMLIAYVSNVRDEEASSASYPRPIDPRLQWLRDEGLWTLERGPAESIEAAQRAVPELERLPPCSGSVDSVTRVNRVDV